MSPRKVKECSECGEEDFNLDRTGICRECQEHLANSEEHDDSDFEASLADGFSEHADFEEDDD